MSGRPSLGDGFGHDLGRLVRSQIDTGVLGARELPFTVVFAITVTAVLLADDVLGPVSLLISVLLAALVQAVAAVGLVRRWPPRVGLVFPLLQIVALVLFAYATGYDRGLFVGLLFLPVINLALQPGRAGVVLGTLAVAVLVFLPPGSGATRERLENRIGGVILVICVFLVAAGASAVTTRLRAQADALAESRDRAKALGDRVEAARAVLASIVDAATEQLVIATDQDGRVLLASPGASTLLRSPDVTRVGASILPYFSEEELRDVAAQRGIPDAPADRMRIIVGAAAHGRTEHRDWTLVRAAGSPFPAGVIVLRRPSLDEPLQDGYLIVATDITERRKAEQLQDEFIGLVSHELRTPLASILGYVDLLLLDESLSDEQVGQLAVIARNARRLLRLVEDLLLSGQVAAGTFQLHGEHVDVGDIVRASVTSLRLNAEAAGVTVAVDAPVPVPLRSDAERLDQVIENLVANAIKFSARGATVDISVRPLDGGARVVVSDTGIGMTARELEQVRTPFFRADEASRGRVRGVGLGLSVTDAIVAAHGGTMTFVSAPGEGTTVTVDLPDLPTPTPERSSPPRPAASTE